MVYSINLQKINFKYFVYRSTQKWQKFRFEYAYFQITKFYQICHFCVAHNIKDLKRIFYRFVGYTIGDIHFFFPIFLKHINTVFDFFYLAGALEFGSHYYFPDKTAVANSFSCIVQWRNMRVHGCSLLPIHVCTSHARADRCMHASCVRAGSAQSPTAQL